MKKWKKIFLILSVVALLSIVGCYFIGENFHWWKSSISQNNSISSEDYFAKANQSSYPDDLQTIELKKQLRELYTNTIIDDMIVDEDNRVYYCCIDDNQRFYCIQVLDLQEEEDSHAGLSFETKDLGGKTFIIKIS